LRYLIVAPFTTSRSVQSLKSLESAILRNKPPFYFGGKCSSTRANIYFGVICNFESWRVKKTIVEAFFATRNNNDVEVCDDISSRFKQHNRTKNLVDFLAQYEASERASRENENEERRVYCYASSLRSSSFTRRAVVGLDLFCKNAKNRHITNRNSNNRISYMWWALRGVRTARWLVLASFRGVFQGAQKSTHHKRKLKRPFSSIWLLRGA